MCYGIKNYNIGFMRAIYEVILSFLNLKHSRVQIPAEYNINHNISSLLFVYLTKIDNRNQKLKPKML